MSVFDEIMKRCKEPKVIQLFQNLNKHRIQLTKQFDGKKQVPRQNVQKILFNLQMDVHYHQYSFDLKRLSDQNLKNLMVLIQSPSEQNKPQIKKKFNIRWKQLAGKKNKIEPPKFLTTSDFKNTIKPKFPESIDQKQSKPQKKGGFFKQVQKDDYKKVISNQPPIQPFNQQRKNENLPKNNNMPEYGQFVSAHTLPSAPLPKATSVRKKFVPPFKKPNDDGNTIQEVENGKEQQDEICKDPIYKGLQKKLIEIIQNQILQTTKSVKWQQIAGLQFAKKLITQMIVWPMLRPDIFTGLRAPPRGILLFGPPGTGKTMIGRAIASSANATFFNISASSLTSKWVGQSEKLVRTLFQIARAKQPSVIFIDEIDSLLCSRSEGQQQSSRRVKTQFLVQLDGTKTNDHERILIIGATNLPQELDDAVRRRFIKRLYIPLPNLQSRRQLFKTLTNNSTFSLVDPQITQLSTFTKGYSGADVHALCKEASMIPLREILEIEKIQFNQVPTAKLSHFKQAIKFVRPSVNKKALAKYEDWNEQFGSYQFNPDQLEQ